jgi:hypothetical protein
MDLRYPIGTYQPAVFSKELLAERLADIRFLPGLLERSLENLDAGQLHTPYREGGWTLQQVVHHICDSHMNALCRLKLTLTEEHPTVRPYNEVAWSNTHEYKLPVNLSVTMIHVLHAKLYDLFSGIEEKDWTRTYYHPESQKDFDLWYLLGMYAWHGKHHVAHITSLRERMGW